MPDLLKSYNIVTQLNVNDLQTEKYKIDSGMSLVDYGVKIKHLPTGYTACHEGEHSICGNLKIALENLEIILKSRGFLKQDE